MAAAAIARMIMSEDAGSGSALQIRASISAVSAMNIHVLRFMNS
jgi:hypothetical protein